MTHACNPIRFFMVIFTVALFGAGSMSSAIAQTKSVPDTVESNPIDNIVLKDGNGADVRLTEFAGRPVILVLGAMNQQRTLRSCDELAKLLARPELSRTDVELVLIVTRDVSDAETPENETRLPDRVYFDPERQAFGTFHVIVMPTIVVLSPESQIVYSMPGFLPRMPEIVGAAVRFASGKSSRQSFEQVIDPPAAIERTDEQKRAMRLANMAEKLRNRGMLEAAAEQFKAAISLDPQSVPALIGFGRVLAQQEQPDQALAQYRAALELRPDSIDALLSLSFLQLGFGEEGVGEAFRTANQLAESDPTDPRVHFLLGSIHQRNRDHEQASKAFKRSAELLLGDMVPPNKSSR